jgi:phosphoglycerol transferase MdoB-like AlkP superfamily enzyme
LGLLTHGHEAALRGGNPFGLLFKRKVAKVMKNRKRLFVAFVLTLIMVCMLGTTAMAAGTGDVAGAIEGTWNDASAQIKTVVNNVVFPAIDLILAVFFFAKLGMAYFDYRKHGQFEWSGPAILFACLVFTLTAPLYVWTILGM